MIMAENNPHVRRFHGRRPFDIDDEAVVNFLDISKGMKVLDVGGADGYYSVKIAARGADVTLIDAHDYNFKELNKVGIKTIVKDFCSFNDSKFDLIFMAHVYHDLFHLCDGRTLENISKITGRYVANLDFTKEDFGFGPPVSMRLEKGEVVKHMKSIGFRLKKDMDIPYHYVQLFERE